MGKINELAISDSNVNMNIVEKYGTFRLQSDKQITENGKHTADVGFNGLSSVNVNVSGGGGADLEDDKTVSITENGVVEITPSAGKDGMKKVTATVNVSGGGGDIPTEWYLWQDQYGDYQYLPFETAPDTLDSLKLVYIGKKLAKDTEIETYGVADYTKNSDTEFIFTDDEPQPSSSTFTRITQDVPIGGGQTYYVYGGFMGGVVADKDVVILTKEPLSANGGTTQISYVYKPEFTYLTTVDFKDIEYSFVMDGSGCTLSTIEFEDEGTTFSTGVEYNGEEIVPIFTIN